MELPTVFWVRWVYVGKHGLVKMAIVTSWSWLLRFGITGHDSNAEQSCGEEGWLYVIPVEQLAVKKIVSTCPTENLGYFSYSSQHFILAKLLWCCREGCHLGFSCSCSCLLLEVLVLACTEVSQLEDVKIGVTPEGDRLILRELLRMMSTEH